MAAESGRIFPYRSFEIAAILVQEKVLDSADLKLKVHGEQGLRMSANVHLADESAFIPMKLSITAGRKGLPSTYRAAFLLNGVRVRGVDFDEQGRKKFYKYHIPKGWHQNIIDPNLSPDDPKGNRHEALKDWAISDFDEFIRKVCTLWHIETGMEARLL